MAVRIRARAIKRCGELPRALQRPERSKVNEKVRWALDFKRIAHRRRALSLDYVPRTL